MDRMLGNQYFMARNYAKAIVSLERAMRQYPDDLSISRKLIISYIANHNLHAAIDKLKVFSNKFSDLVFIDGLADANCPCPKLLDEWKNEPPKSVTQADYYIALGILELFCGNQNGCLYFEKAKDISPDQELINELLSELK